MHCQVHKGCMFPPVAVVGLPGRDPVHACRKGFDEWKAAGGKGWAAAWRAQVTDETASERRAREAG